MNCKFHHFTEQIISQLSTPIFQTNLVKPRLKYPFCNVRVVYFCVCFRYYCTWNITSLTTTQITQTCPCMIYTSVTHQDNPKNSSQFFLVSLTYIVKRLKSGHTFTNLMSKILIHCLCGSCIFVFFFLFLFFFFFIHAYTLKGRLEVVQSLTCSYKWCCILMSIIQRFH